MKKLLIGLAFILCVTGTWALVDNATNGASLPSVALHLYNGTNWIYAKVCSKLGILAIIDVAHYKAHEGDRYTATDNDTSVDTPEAKYWQLVTHASVIGHATIAFDTDAAGLLTLFEGATSLANGAAWTIYNDDRNDGTLTNTNFTFTIDPTDTGSGTSLRKMRFGTGSGGPISFGGSGGTRSEIILKVNTKYIIQFLPDADATSVGIDINFYEE